MPKMKTNSGAKKRFRVNKKGTVKFRKAYARHSFKSKTPDQNRRARGTGTLGPADAKKVKKELFPYGHNA